MSIMLRLYAYANFLIMVFLLSKNAGNAEMCVCVCVCGGGGGGGGGGRGMGRLGNA